MPERMRIGVYPQGSQYLKARHVWKVEIEQDDVVVVKSAEIDTLFPEVSRVNVEALALEHQLNRLRDRTIILDQ
jgi:hypothetical protein